jgi:hypothetical protein
MRFDEDWRSEFIVRKSNPEVVLGIQNLVTVPELAIVRSKPMKGVSLASHLLTQQAARPENGAVSGQVRSSSSGVRTPVKARSITE